jgi:hypothetical protein
MNDLRISYHDQGVHIIDHFSDFGVFVSDGFDAVVYQFVVAEDGFGSLVAEEKSVDNEQDLVDEFIIVLLLEENVDEVL